MLLFYLFLLFFLPFQSAQRGKETTAIVVTTGNYTNVGCIPSLFSCLVIADFHLAHARAHTRTHVYRLYVLAFSNPGLTAV